MPGMGGGNICKAGGMGVRGIYLYVMKEHATKGKSVESFR